MADVTVTKDLENKKLVIEFVVNAPKDEAWQAYADQALFEKWWGPEGWETVAKEFAFIPGGRIHYSMKCVDKNQADWFGQTSWGLMNIEEINDGTSFTYKDYFSDENRSINNELAVLTVTNQFIEEGGKTRIISTSLADSSEDIEQLITMGMVEGFSSQLTKLDQLFS